MLEAPCSNAQLQARIVVSSAPIINGKQIYTLNSVSFIPADTPLKIADYSNILGVFSLGTISANPNVSGGYLQTSIMAADFRGFAKIVLRIQKIPCSHGTLMDDFSLSSDKSAFQWTNESAKYNMNRSMMTDKASMFCSYYYFLPDWLFSLPVTEKKCNLDHGSSWI